MARPPWGYWTDTISWRDSAGSAAAGSGAMRWRAPSLLSFGWQVLVLMLLASHTMTGQQPHLPLRRCATAAWMRGAGARPCNCSELAALYRVNFSNVVCYLASGGGGAPWPPPATLNHAGTYVVPAGKTAIIQGLLGGDKPDGGAGGGGGGADMRSRLRVRIDVVSSKLLLRGVEMASLSAAAQSEAGPNDVNRVGGALFVDLGSLRVENSRFINNSAGGYAGGAIYAQRAQRLTLANCTFVGNAVGGSGGNSFGGAVGISGASGGVSIVGCVFRRNGAGLYGAAVYVRDGSLVTVSQSNFTDNRLPTSHGGESKGGAVSVFGATRELNVSECVFSGNAAASGSAVWLRVVASYVYNSTLSKAMFRRAVFSGCSDQGGGSGDHEGATSVVAWDNQGANPAHMDTVAGGQLAVSELRVARTGTTGARWAYFSLVPRRASCILDGLPSHAYPVSPCGDGGRLPSNSSCSVECRGSTLFGHADAACRRGQLIWKASCADANCTVASPCQHGSTCGVTPSQLTAIGFLGLTESCLLASLGR